MNQGRFPLRSFSRSLWVRLLLLAVAATALAALARLWLSSSDAGQRVIELALYATLVLNLLLLHVLSRQRGKQQHTRAIQQLARERDRLDQRVALRTAELAYLNGYLRLISGTSLKLMHLRPEQYPLIMGQTLQSLGQYLHLDACVLLDNQQPRAHWMKQEDTAWLQQVSQLKPPAHSSGWTVNRLSERSLAVVFSNPQRSFMYAVRGETAAAVDSTQESLLLGAAQWLYSLVQHWDHVIGLDQARQELLDMSRTDPLTGLANRRHFEQHLSEELRRARRMAYPVSLLMLDVDFFKAFNDRYGHAGGDSCLQSLARLMDTRFKRAGEMVARIGGEEFAVVLPGLDLDAAHQVAEALGMALYDQHIPHAGSPWGRVTVSIGCTHWAVQQGGDTEQIIARLMHSADVALYNAKHAGRNQVVSARD